MNRTLIVARIQPGAESEVARLFAESDLTELPHIAGVTRRELYSLGDLYVHVLETEAPGGAAVEEARRHPEFARVSRALDEFITPYSSNWRGPQDAIARPFYTWQPQAARRHVA